jgi:hypothetical protein
VPPFLFWAILPGFDRLQRASRLADTAAFTAEGFLRWLNRVRPAGAEAMIDLPLYVEGVELYRTRAEWWGGSP